MKAWHCQAALALTQTAFCVGSVYLKSSLRQVHPRCLITALPVHAWCMPLT